MRSGRLPIVVATLALLLQGCSLLSYLPGRGDEPPRLDPAQELLVRAREHLDANRHRKAREAYVRVILDWPGSPEAFHARWGLTWIRLDPESPLASRRSARINLERLLQEFGDQGGEWEPWVRSMHTLLVELSECKQEGSALEEEVSELEDDVFGLETDLDHLRQLDMDLELEQ